MRSLLPLLPLVLSLSACPPGADDPTPTCTVDDEQPAATLIADVGDARWEASAGTVNVSAAAGMNLTFTENAQNTASIRLIRATEWSLDDAGEVVESEGMALVSGGALAFTADDLPLVVKLGDAAEDGGDATVVVDSSTHHSSHGDGGFLKLVEWIEDEAGGAASATGCLQVDAGEQNGSSTASLSDGSFSVNLP
jgi:hypothetical protein